MRCRGVIAVPVRAALFPFLYSYAPSEMPLLTPRDDDASIGPHPDTQGSKWMDGWMGTVKPQIPLAFKIE